MAMLNEFPYQVSVRVPKKTLEAFKDLAKQCGVSQCELVQALVSDADAAKVVWEWKASTLEARAREARRCAERAKGSGQDGYSDDDLYR